MKKKKIVVNCVAKLLKMVVLKPIRLITSGASGDIMDVSWVPG